MALLEREYVLPPFGELRVVTSGARQQPTRVVLLPRAAGDEGDGAPRAEMFGAELQAGVPASLPLARSLAVFSPTGCRLRLTAPAASLQRAYATSTGALWMRSLLDLHGHLESLRHTARTTDGVGPRVLVVGDRARVGCSAYVQWLSQFAVRLGYHPLLLDAVRDAPRFGLPSCLSLFHLQHPADVEEELSLMPSAHVFTGAPRESSPRLFRHALRELMRLATAKSAALDRCRVGGVFVDYGAIPPHLVEAAEASEARAALPSDGSPAPAPVPNPIDALLDTIAETGAEDVIVVQSAWLRFKIAQRAHQRFGEGDLDAATAVSTPATVAAPRADLAFKLLLVDAVEVAHAPPPALSRRLRWMQYFFGTATSPLRPTLARLPTSSVRIATTGRAAHSSLATTAPMRDDDDADDGTLGSNEGPDPTALALLTTEDVDLPGRIVAISSATEYVVGEDGALQRLGFVEFERRVRQGFVIGFGLVREASATELTLLVNGSPLRKDLGLCLLVTEERLQEAGSV